MNEMIRIEGQDLEIARLDSQAYYTLMEADALPNHGRTELIEGVLVPMSPSSNPHGFILVDLTAALAPLAPSGLKGCIDVAISFSEGLVLAPDLAFVPKQYKTEVIPGREIALIIEVSVSSIGHDLNLKSQIYGAQGVPHYWVVDVDSRVTHVHTSPGAEGYGSAQQVSWDEPIAPTFAPDAKLVFSETFEN
ncbi:MAG: Uma2 family endonuclease [Ahrensia sp.]|nr:Uma2 family endonuclease [Ahrensia sp.]